MRIVLDSNILLVIVGKKSKYWPIWEAFINGRYKLIISEDILHEYEEILLEHASANIASLVMEIFLESPDVIYQRVFYYWNAISLDAEDNKFFDISVAGNANFLVTNDGHFNEVRNRPFPSVNIISINQFLEIVSKLV